MVNRADIDEHNRIEAVKRRDAKVLSIEMTQEVHEGESVLKVTYFEGGLDVAMFRFATLNTALNSIRQFYAGGRMVS